MPMSIDNDTALNSMQSSMPPPMERGRFAVIAGALLAIIVVWSSITGLLLRERNLVIAAEERALERMSLVVEEQARHLFSLVEFFLVSADLLLVNNPNDDPRNSQEFLNLVDTLREKSGGTIDIHLISDEGDLYSVSSLDGKRSINVRDRDYFRSQYDPFLRGLHIGIPMFDAVRQEWLLPISYPLSGRHNDISMIVTLLEVSALVDSYEKGRTKPDGSIALVHRNGTVLARAAAGESSVGMSIAQGKIWLEHLPKSDGGVALLPTTAVDKTARLTAYSALNDFPLVAIASSTMDNVLASWWRRAYGSVLFGLFLTALIAFAARRLSSLLAELTKSHQELDKQASLDSLTGLPNRRYFLRRLKQEIAQADRNGRPVVLLFIDLDLFKEVNDTLGHNLGDMLLKEAAQRLRHCVRSSDTLARLGGDEFTVILPERNDKHAVERLAREILETLATPFYLEDKASYVSASIGITCYPQDASGIDDLLTNADQAMYAAKNAGRNRWEYFTPSMQKTAQLRMQLFRDARAALAEGGQFRLYYQPIVEPRTGIVRKAEALIRWQHPTRGFIPPSEFIPLLEETDLIIDLGEWAFHEAARQVAQWRLSIHPDFQISVNVSPAQFRSRREGTENWGRYLQQLGLPSDSIVVEITEGVILKADESVSGRLLDLVDSGIQLSLDDFGTGYSSLSHLKKFDIDYIKIDQSFVTELEKGTEDFVLCEGIIMMAHKLGIQVVAEGVEDERQCKTLIEIGCDYAQGYLFSKALPADEFERLIKRRESLASPSPVCGHHYTSDAN